MNNLRKFSTEAGYSAATLNYPAVSWVTATDNVYFNKSASAAFSGLTVYYNITDISQQTVLFKGGGGSGSGSGSGSGGALPSAMIIDGTAVEVTNTYQFSTTGEHIVNYSFADSQIPEQFLYDGESIKFNTVTKVVIGDSITIIPDSKFGNGVFMQCQSLTSVTIGNGVTSIGSNAFYYCYGLTSITIPDSVTSIGSLAFGSCRSLTSVTVNATTPPSCDNTVFDNTNNCPIYVPAASVSAYINASSWDAYTDRIQAIH